MIQQLSDVIKDTFLSCFTAFLSLVLALQLPTILMAVSFTI